MSEAFPCFEVVESRNRAYGAGCIKVKCVIEQDKRNKTYETITWLHQS